jgi:hypothetical protein
MNQPATPTIRPGAVHLTALVVPHSTPTAIQPTEHAPTAEPTKPEESHSPSGTNSVFSRLTMGTFDPEFGAFVSTK